jgi:hypothetical protein
MGSFLAYFCTGVFLALLAIWWILISSYRYIKTIHSQINSNYNGSYSMPCLCLSNSRIRNLPIEALTRILMISINLLVLTAHGLQLNQNRLAIGEENSYYLTILCGFLVSSMFEVFIHYFPNVLPPKSVFVFNFISVLIMNLMNFGLKMHDRSKLDIHLHQLFGYVVFLLAIAHLIEIFKPNEIWSTLFRSYCVFILGTWLIHISIVLWPISTGKLLSWDLNSERNITLMTSLFGIHFIGASILILFIYLFIYVNFNRFDEFYDKSNVIEFRQLQTNERVDQEYIAMLGDDESISTDEI